ncbi:MAG: DUF1822 family protein [Heteroscytonema crispum UTEX LB 1556]
MSANPSESTLRNSNIFNIKRLTPAEIWELNQSVQTPLELSSQEQWNLYSEPARRFLEGKSPPRYVMIVTEPEPLLDSEEVWQEVTVMVLSEETNFSSNVDILIPKEISGMGQDLLAETWHVLPMLTCNLLQPLGRRLSREIYDVLLNVGDCYHKLIDKAPSKEEIQTLGLQVGIVSINSAFHHQEEAWSDVLSVPLAACRIYIKGMKLTETLLNETLELEVICLSNWLQNIFDAGWIALSDFLDTQAPSLAIAFRSGENSEQVNPNSEEIAALINQLSSEKNEFQLRRAAKRLGDIAKGNNEAILALINLLRNIQDDETLWTVVESLWQIDPGNPAAGVRRVKLIDLGMQVAGQTVALAVGIIQKSNNQIGVMLRVYPTGNEPYLPSNLKLILLDDSGKNLREVTARKTDVYIQLKLNGQPGEQFSVRVALQAASITEDFSI